MCLEDKKVAILISDKFDDLEAFYPFYRLKEAGIQVIFIGMDEGSEVCTVNMVIN